MKATPVSAEVVTEFSAICADIVAKWDASRRGPAPSAPAPQPTREQLQAELRKARCGFDAAYPYTDDHSFFCEQHAKHKRINALEAQLARLQMSGLCPAPEFPGVRSVR
jgi:hypothetical protein